MEYLKALKNKSAPNSRKINSLPRALFNICVRSHYTINQVLLQTEQHEYPKGTLNILKSH